MPPDQAVEGPDSALLLVTGRSVENGMAASQVTVAGPALGKWSRDESSRTEKLVSRPEDVLLTLDSCTSPGFTCAPPIIHY